ncbi:MAG: DNA-processing protein DprA [Bacteroidota bacterium]
MIPVFDIIVLSRIPGIGVSRLRQFISHFRDAELIYKVSPKEIVEVEGFSRKLATEVAHFLKSSELDAAKKLAEIQLSKINSVGGRIVTCLDKTYPDLLKKIYDPPPFLFIRGEFSSNDAYSIAIVGTRTASDYGVSMAEKFSHEISSRGITVISGLARGIDTVAHVSALKAGGRTIAVMGSGLDKIYPPENRSLAEKIVDQGVLISECLMGAKPDAVNFPKRNRIVSGMSLGTLIIETDIDGGAMITATTALDQNREVFAIPGNIGGKRCRGANLLIKTGRAKLVESFDDIAAELQVKLRPILTTQPGYERKPLPEMTLFEQTVFNVLSDVPCQIDAIADTTKLSISETLVNLLNLEFKGIIKQLPGKMFIRN